MVIDICYEIEAVLYCIGAKPIGKYCKYGNNKTDNGNSNNLCTDFNELPYIAYTFSNLHSEFVDQRLRFISLKYKLFK